MRGRIRGRDPLEALRRVEHDDRPMYHIGVAAAMLGVHQQTLRHYERAGLIEPKRSDGNIRMYSPRDIERLLAITWLSHDLGISLSGIEIILELHRRLDDMESEVHRLRSEAAAARGLFLEDGAGRDARRGERQSA